MPVSIDAVHPSFQLNKTDVLNQACVTMLDHGVLTVSHELSRRQFPVDAKRSLTMNGFGHIGMLTSTLGGYPGGVH